MPIASVRLPNAYAVAVTFNRYTAGEATPSATIAGEAIKKMRGNPDRYRELGLVISRDPTLLFVPTTAGARVEPGDRVQWPDSDGSTYTVREVTHLEPSGAIILSEVICSL